MARIALTCAYSLFLVCTFLSVLVAAQLAFIGKPPIPPVQPAPAASLDSFRQEALHAHNTLRQKHGSPALKLSPDLDTMAQNYAEKLARTNTFQHSGAQLNGQPIGENLAEKWGTGGVDYKGAEVTQAWYDEIKDYNFNHPGFSEKTGHFTQVVWKSTLEIGLGKAFDSSGKVYVVANYRPAGNYLGQFPANVLPPK